MATIWEMIKKDDLLDKLQAEKQKENDLRLKVVDMIIECDDPEKRNELKDQNVVHTAIINTIDAVIKIINDQPAMRMINGD